MKPTILISIIISVVLWMGEVVDAQKVDSTHKYQSKPVSHNANPHTLFGMSFGYSTMMDKKYSQWLSDNGQSIHNIYYLGFKATIARIIKSNTMVGLDFDFYGSLNDTAHYPLRMSIGALVGNSFRYGHKCIFLSGTLGYYRTRVNNPIPFLLTNVNTLTSQELNQEGLFFSPSLKLLWNNLWCKGLDFGARIYEIISRIPNLTSIDFYINFFIGGYPSK